MNDAQQIYMVFFAVLLGANLTSMKNFSPFQWGFFKESPRAFCYMLFRRLIVGIFIFNFIPALVFGVQLFFWEYFNFTNEIRGIYKIIAYSLVAFSAISAFIPYRLYHCIFSSGYQYMSQLSIQDEIVNKWYVLYPWADYEKIVNDRGVRPYPIVHWLAVASYLLLAITAHYICKKIPCF